MNEETVKPNFIIPKKWIKFILMNIKYTLYILLLLMSCAIQAQAFQKEFWVKGTVKDQDSREPIQGATVSVNGTYKIDTDVFGDFRIRARIGDRLEISHFSFETVLYTIKDGQRIDIWVQDREKRRGAESKTYSKRKTSSDIIYQKNLKAAKNNLQKDASISIDYVTRAFESIDENGYGVKNKKGELFEVLGDLYDFWKQPDLAEENYIKSLQNLYDRDIKIKLGTVQLANHAYGQALETFNQLKTSRLNAKQKMLVYEGLGDVYSALGEIEESILNYNKAVKQAVKNNNDEKEILLNSKLAKVLQQKGSVSEAEIVLGNSIKLADKKNRKAAARQRTQAADFYNKNLFYQKEIELRKEALEDIEEIQSQDIAEEERLVMDSIALKPEEERALTTQVQNYKIASAFAAQSEYDEAIPYLEESIKEAKSKNDLVVQKDATRKLGEVYREKGDLKKASETFENYEAIVDKLYFRKEQEISQANRFSRELAKRANRIATLEKDRELNESRYQLAFAAQELGKQQSLRQRIIIYSLFGLMAFLLLAGYLMYRNNRQQRYANNLLALKSLRSQMNPHFIFNALNSVNTFIAASDERTANRYLTDFSKLMRSVLENSEQDYIPLEKEVELLRLYVQLEHFRFMDKFDYKFEVNESIDLSSFAIPPMLLQPYVENAVWHGLRYKTEKGLLRIAFNTKGKDGILITILDDGIGRKQSKVLKTENQKKQKSQGMSNIKKRIAILNQMYKGKIEIFVSDVFEDGSGTEVKVHLKKIQ